MEQFKYYLNLYGEECRQMEAYSVDNTPIGRPSHRTLPEEKVEDEIDPPVNVAKSWK